MAQGVLRVVMSMTEARMREAFDRELQRARDMGANFHGAEPYLVLNRRLIRSAGRATVNGPHHGRIELAPKIFLDPRNQEGVEEMLTQTIRHELAHIMAPGARHGARWRDAMAFLGSPADRYHQMKTRRRPVRFWELTCNACGKSLGLKNGRNRPSAWTARKVSGCCRARVMVQETSNPFNPSNLKTHAH